MLCIVQRNMNRHFDLHEMTKRSVKFTPTYKKYIMTSCHGNAKHLISLNRKPTNTDITINSSCVQWIWTLLKRVCGTEIMCFSELFCLPTTFPSSIGGTRDIWCLWANIVLGWSYHQSTDTSAPSRLNDIVRNDACLAFRYTHSAHNQHLLHAKHAMLKHRLAIHMDNNSEHHHRFHKLFSSLTPGRCHFQSVISEYMLRITFRR